MKAKVDALDLTDLFDSVDILDKRLSFGWRRWFMRGEAKLELETLVDNMIKVHDGLLFKQKKA